MFGDLGGVQRRELTTVEQAREKAVADDPSNVANSEALSEIRARKRALRTEFQDRRRLGLSNALRRLFGLRHGAR